MSRYRILIVTRVTFYTYFYRIVIKIIYYCLSNDIIFCLKITTIIIIIIIIIIVIIAITEFHCITDSWPNIAQWYYRYTYTTKLRLYSRRRRCAIITRIIIISALVRRPIEISTKCITNILLGKPYTRLQQLNNYYQLPAI